jgi:Zn-dependent protease with chaperone function
MTTTYTPRLNPFAFPSETDFRFILLLVSVVGASLFIYGDLYFTFVWNENSGFSPAICVALMIFGCFLTLGTTVLLYWCLPAWKIKRSDLHPLEKAEIPGLMPYLLALAEEAELSRPPQFLWNPLDQTKEGYAFGRWGQLYVYLPRGLTDCYTKNKSEFRAIALHELAHIRNGDVHKTYLSYSVWRAFLITCVPIFTLTLLQSSSSRMVGMGVRVLILFLLIYLTRNAVLRVREFYADLRASIWDKESSALRLAIESAQKTSTSKSFWQHIWLTHPKLSARSRVLEDPSPLFNMGFWEAFATGMAVMIPFTNLIATFGFALVTTNINLSALSLGLIIFTLPALVVAFLMIYIVGVGIWRITFAAAAHHRPARRVYVLGLGLAFGIGMGQQVSFIGASSLLTNPGIFVIWIGLLVIALTTFFNWISIGAQFWFGPAVTSYSPRPFYRWGLLISSALLACIFASLFAAFIAFSGGTSPTNFAVFNPFISFSLIGLWAFPLMACVWKHQYSDLKAKPASWLYLDKISPDVVDTTPQLNRFKASLFIGGAGGIIGCLSILLLNSLGLNTLEPLVATSMMIQGLTAAIATASTSCSSSISGLFAASTAGMLLVIGYLLGAPTLNFGTHIFAITGIFNSGGLFAIPVVLVVATISSGLRCLLKR